MNVNVRALALAAACLLAVAGVCDAQIATYFGNDDPRGTLANSFAARAAFQSALTSFGTDNIEGYDPFTPDPMLTFGGLGVTAATDVDFVGETSFYAVSGNRFLLSRIDFDGTNGTPNLPSVFTLSSAVTAFGMFFVNVGDPPNSTDLSIRLENTVTLTDKTIGIGSFSGRQLDATFFFGITDFEPFNRVTILPSTAGGNVDGMVFDDVTVGFAAVPEPASLSLLGAGACAAVAFLQRRKNAGRRG